MFTPVSSPSTRGSWWLCLGLVATVCSPAAACETKDGQACDPQANGAAIWIPILAAVLGAVGLVILVLVVRQIYKHWKLRRDLQRETDAEIAQNAALHRAAEHDMEMQSVVPDVVKPGAATQTSNAPSAPTEFHAKQHTAAQYQMPIMPADWTDAVAMSPSTVSQVGVDSDIPALSTR